MHGFLKQTHDATENWAVASGITSNLYEEYDKKWCHNIHIPLFLAMDPFEHWPLLWSVVNKCISQAFLKLYEANFFKKIQDTRV